MRRIYLLITLFCLFLTKIYGWSHIELGAGNYGADGHTKVALDKTVLMKLEEVSDEINFIDDLEEVGCGEYNPKEQYGVLFWTLDELVRRYGNEGIFYVNDLCEEYALFATEKLQDYADERGYHFVTVVALPGDYESLYCLEKVNSIHLKNPECSFYHNKMDGHNFTATEESRQQTRTLLQRLANLSQEGLFLFILDHPNFIPDEEKLEFVDQGIFYQQTNEWESVPYIFPEGKMITGWGIVLFISGTEENSREF